VVVSIAVGVLGAAGAMGQEVLDVLGEGMHLHAAVVRPGSSREGHPVPGHGGVFRGLQPGVFDGCDVVIDFSLPAGLHDALPLLDGMPLVTGTTGIAPDTEPLLARHATTAPQLQAANFSAGVTLLLDLVARAAAALPDADLEVVEAHHRRKRDAPSGTALALVEALQGAREGGRPVHGRDGAVGPRSRDEIGVHAIRGGDVVGDHTVWLLADGERLSLQHIASRRGTFAAGAVRAAQWIVDQRPGSYTMRHVLGLTDR
jgi:4-hydroxy-tetrahydrodipicolinate reductase